MCAAGQTCSGGLCVPANCTPLTCALAGGGQYCGKIGDGCGGSLDCQGCSAPMTCGGANIAGVCGTSAASCTNRLNCNPMGGQYCGVVGDNCGGSIDCGACTNGMACRSDHLCPSTGPGPCQGLQCQLDKPGECTGAGTTISGSVFDPAGKVPLYNVLLYVPNTALGPISTGASCDRCDSPISGTPVAAALTGADGKFKIMNAPSGTNIPLVIQIGKWRRKIILPTVTKCQDNAFNDPNTVRLPRSMSDRAAGDAAGDVHMPQIALSTGHSDALDCLLRKIGIADSEFTPDSGTGRVHMYVGGAGKSGDQGSKMLASGGDVRRLVRNAVPELRQDGRLRHDHAPVRGRAAREREDAVPRQHEALRRQRRARVRRPPALGVDPDGACRPGRRPPTGSASATTCRRPSTASVDMSFPKGAALADWLVNNGASTTRGQISLVMGQHSVAAVNAPAARRWIWVPQNTNDSEKRESTQYLTFNTPVESAAANQCGRVVFTDVHVSLGAGDSSHPETPFPIGLHGAADADRAGEGAGVHVLRPVVVRADRNRHADDAADPAAGHGARRRRPSRRPRPPAPPPPPPPPPPPDPG